LPKSRQQKEQMLGEYHDRIGRAQVMVWSRYQAMTVKRIDELRGQLRGVGAEATVVKNTVMHKALIEAERPFDKEMMTGPCLVTFIYDNIPAATKIIADYARTHEANLRVQGGVLGTTLLDAKQVAALVNLPPRDVLLGQVLGTMQAPIANFVSVLAGVVRGLVNVLDAHAKQLEGSPS